MTARPPRDVRADAQTTLTNILRTADAPAPHFLAQKLLTGLDGIHIGLTDTRPPEDPNADWRPPPNATPVDAETPGTAAYQAARQALKGQQ